MGPSLADFYRLYFGIVLLPYVTAAMVPAVVVAAAVAAVAR